MIRRRIFASDWNFKQQPTIQKGNISKDIGDTHLTLLPLLKNRGLRRIKILPVLIAGKYLRVINYP